MTLDLHDELTRLRRTILSMGAAVEYRLSEAVGSVLENDLNKAAFVIEGDREIDEMDVDIEENCLRILALSQPVAKDLRLVLSALRINNDLERIADLAVAIAKRAKALQSAPAIEFPEALEQMCTQTRGMLSDAMTALADDNTDLARQIRRSDDRVDDLQRDIFAWTQQAIMDDVQTTESVIDVLSVARKLERIADHATNIAEDIIFLIEGAVVRHTAG